MTRRRRHLRTKRATPSVIGEPPVLPLAELWTPRQVRAFEQWRVEAEARLSDTEPSAELVDLEHASWLAIWSDK